MREAIELCNADLTKATFKDVMFFSIAESGAMGEPGAVLFYVKSGELYYLNYVYGDADIRKIERLFPVLTKCQFGIFGIDSVTPEGWKYVSLGMGNHLIVREDVYETFIKEVGADTPPSVLYGSWLEVAEGILQNKRC